MDQLSISCNVIWKSNHTQFTINNMYYHIPNKSSLLLLSDGSFTKILDSLIGNTTHIQLMKDQQIYRNIEFINTWYDCKDLKMYRQGWLQDKSGSKLVFASSWYKTQLLKDISSIKDLNIIPLGKVFIKSELILYRKLYCISCLCSKWFERQFQMRGYIWSREYILYYKTDPIIFIREFFSPKLTTNLENNIY